MPIGTVVGICVEAALALTDGEVGDVIPLIAGSEDARLPEEMFEGATPIDLREFSDSSWEEGLVGIAVNPRSSWLYIEHVIIVGTIIGGLFMTCSISGLCCESARRD